MSMADVTNMGILGGMYGPNMYSNFSGKVPQPNYVGQPTDALGNPIPMPQGTTLNGTPSTPSTRLTTNGMAGQFPDNPAAGQLAALGPGSSIWTGPTPGVPAGQMDLNSALPMLANPGHVTTPGASPGAGSGGPDVLSQFLANENSSGPGAGGYSNKGFFDTLNALKSGGAGGLGGLGGMPAAAAPAASSTPVSGQLPAASGAPNFNLAQLQALQQSDPNGQGGITSQEAAAGIGSMGQLRGLRSQLMAGGMGGSMYSPTALPTFHGIGSGNGGAAGNGSAGGQ